jgi:PucR family transcriptional regulator, purine catabolism regulatory protein
VISVRAALKVPPLRVGKPEVLAGHANLDRTVRWVHAGEVPGMPALLRGGELLLTTGMGLGATAAEQRTFARGLGERGVSALAIELGEALPEIPGPLVAEAEAQALPLIAIHRQVRFVEITEAIHREIVDRQVVVMRRGEEIQQRFTEMMLDGAGIPEVLGALAETIANPVFLERADRGVPFHAVHHGSDAAAFGAWEEVRRGGGALPHVSVPVRGAGGEAWGRLWAVGLDSPLDDFDAVAVERAVSLVALALMRSRQEDVLAVRRPGRFLGRLLEADLGEIEARETALAMGFSSRLTWLLPLVATRVRAASALGEEAAWAAVWADLRRELASDAAAVIAGTLGLGHDLAIVVGLDGPEDREAMADRIAAVLHAAGARHFGVARSIAVGAGPATDSWQALSEALREALEAAGDPGAEQMPWCDGAAPSLPRLLRSLRDVRQVGVFVERRLAPLLEHDRTRSFQLVETLRVYLAHNGHKATTARALNVNRQTLYHRLERIEEILGERLDDEDARQGLHLALRLHDGR